MTILNLAHTFTELQIPKQTDNIHMCKSTMASSSSKAFCPVRTVPVIVGVCLLFYFSSIILGRHVSKEKESLATSSPLHCQKKTAFGCSLRCTCWFCLSWHLCPSPPGVFPLTLIYVNLQYFIISIAIYP